MNRMLHVFVGIVAIGGGATLFATYIGEFNKHYQIQGNPIPAQGYITEIKINAGKSELYYQFEDLVASKIYTGSSVLEGTQYELIPVGMPTPVEYLQGKPEVNRHQFARNAIFTLGRNVAVGAFLVLLGFAVFARGFGSSTPAVTSEFVEVES